MTAEKEIHLIFRAELIAERKYGEVTFRLFANKIFYVQIPRFEKIGTDIIEAGYRFLNDHGGGEFHNIYHFDSFSDVEPETREWAADRSGNKYTISDAIVIGSMSQKIITDFYLKFNKPVRPTKIFYSLEKSVSWTIEKMEP